MSPVAGRREGDWIVLARRRLVLSRALTGSVLALVGVALVGLVLVLYEMRTPEFLAFYDSGVYVAAAAHLFSGALPYRDYAFLQPPGILVTLAPVGLLSHLGGTHAGLVAARWLAAVVAVANAVLVAHLVRFAGRVAMFVAGALVVTVPVAMYVTTNVKLDSYAVLFALVAAALLIGPGGTIAEISRRRALGAGALLGVAVSVKFTAALLALAAVIVVAVRARRHLRTVVAAMAGGFGAIVLPFALADPGGFLAQAVRAQLLRRGDATDAMSLTTRLANLTGLWGSSLAPGGLTLLVLWVGVLALVVTALRRARGVGDADWLLATSAATASVGLLLPSHAYAYYFYLPVVYVLATTTLSAGRLLLTPARWLERRLSARLRAPLQVAVVSAVVVAGLSAALWSSSFYSAQAWAFGFYGPWVQPVARVVPAGACAVYEDEAVGVYANRALSGPACPVPLDSYGMWLEYRDTPNAHRPVPAGLVAQWRTILARADYAVLNDGRFGPHHRARGNIPWTPPLWRWFSARFHQVYAGHYVTIFQRDGAL